MMGGMISAAAGAMPAQIAMQTLRVSLTRNECRLGKLFYDYILPKFHITSWRTKLCQSLTEKTKTTKDARKQTH